ncbi:MAG: hypothetical protein AB8B56_10075 [Crocinitomicaceae bacterium]
MKKNKLKEMFVLSWLSNVNSNYVTPRQRELNKNLMKIDDVLNDPVVQNMTGGKWDIVWGPAACNSEYLRSCEPILGKTKNIKRWVTDNAMYVAQKAGTNEYFIGISGTNGVSLKGWFEQDFDVEESVPWPLESLGSNSVAVKGKPRISKAGQKGIESLWNMKPKGAMKESGTRLIDFLLGNVEGKECTISIGGHSLGGCLTAILAAAISDKVAENKAAYGGVKINAYPTAGPTPGNQDFANHLAENINEYHAVYNENDLVPLSWDFEKLEQFKKEYSQWKFGGDMIRPNEPVNANLLLWASNFAKEQRYVRQPSFHSPNFQVFTWQNDLIETIKINGGDMSENELRWVVLGAGIAITQEKSPVTDQLSRIMNYRSKEHASAAHLLRFLIQILLQHLTAYLSPTSSNGVPWSFTDNEKTALTKLFLNRKKSIENIEKDTKEWGIATGLKLLADLLKQAADWLDNVDHDTSSLVIGETLENDSPISKEKDLVDVNLGGEYPSFGNLYEPS